MEEDGRSSRRSPASSAAAAAGAAGRRNRSGAKGVREDCWSEGATAALIEAWGEKFLDLSRGNLRHNDWQEVADIVNGRHGGEGPPKTHGQCKNRVDTLKKKYKLEKARLAAGGAAASHSKWVFFDRLQHLVGVGAAAPQIPPALPPPQRKPPATQIPALLRAATAAAAAAPRSPESSESFLAADLPAPLPKKRKKTEGDGDEDLRALTEAILKLGRAYERVESSKLKQAMEMEKQRMEFTKELELQRVHFFVKTQLELTHLNHQTT